MFWFIPKEIRKKSLKNKDGRAGLVLNGTMAALSGMWLEFEGEGGRVGTGSYDLAF